MKIVAEAVLDSDLESDRLATSLDRPPQNIVPCLCARAPDAAPQRSSLSAAAERRRGDGGRQAQEFARRVVDAMAEPVIVVDGARRVQYLNPAAETLLGWQTEAALTRPFDSVCRLIDARTRRPVEPDVRRRGRGARRGDARPLTLLITADDRELPVHESVSSMRDGSGRVAVILHGVGARREAVSPSVCPPGELPDRREAEQRLARIVAGVRADASRHVLAYLDIDRFKAINDACGRAAGDELLRQFSALVQGFVRAQDTVACLGGDTFAVILEHCSVARAESIVGDFLKMLDKFHFQWERWSFRISASVGLVAVRDDSVNAGTVLAAAEAACSAAKRSGGNRLRVQAAAYRAAA